MIDKITDEKRFARDYWPTGGCQIPFKMQLNTKFEEMPNLKI